MTTHPISGRRAFAGLLFVLSLSLVLLRPAVSAAHCGNGVIEEFETCDPPSGTSGGRLPGTCATYGLGPSCNEARCNDGCYVECVIQCGDGCLAGAEECDEGAENDDLGADACRTDCRAARCGDGTADTGEECDRGPLNSDTMPDACRSSCVNPRCGDAVIDVARGEQCDLGALNSNAPGSECSTACRIPFCGNGSRETGEQCDDGNTVNTDDCTTLCRYNVCGDGFPRSGGMLPAEICDDGNNDDGDDCRYDCYQDLTQCGDGTTQLGEECDAATANADTPDASCRTDCLLPRCGDGVVDTGEECDGASDCGADCTFASGQI